MTANQIDTEQVKKELKNCPLIVQQYAKALEQVCKTKQETIDKAVNKIREITNINKKWECYEIHTVQARMYGCNSQCEECKLKQQFKDK